MCFWSHRKAGFIIQHFIYQFWKTPSVNLSHAQFLSLTGLVRKSPSKVEKRAEKRNRWTFWNPPSPSPIISDSAFLSKVLPEYCWLQSLSWNPFRTTSMVSILASIRPSSAGVSIEPNHSSSCCRTCTVTVPTVLSTVPCSSTSHYLAVSRNQLCRDIGILVRDSSLCARGKSRYRAVWKLSSPAPFCRSQVSCGRVSVFLFHRKGTAAYLWKCGWRWNPGTPTHALVWATGWVWVRLGRVFARIRSVRTRFDPFQWRLYRLQPAKEIWFVLL